MSGLNVQSMYLWALTMFFASAGINQDSTQKPMPLGVNTSMFTPFFTSSARFFDMFMSPPLPTATQMSPRANSSMKDGLKRLMSGRTFFKTSAAAFKSSKLESAGFLPMYFTTNGKISLGESHKLMPQDFNLLVYSGLNTKSHSFSGNWSVPKAALTLSLLMAKVFKPEK